MANAQRIKELVENWYRDKLAEKQTGNTVTQEKVNLIWGGKFEVDAVVKSNNKIKEVHYLSVSEYKTAGNNSGSGKLQKIKADALMMMGIKCDKKVLAFLGETMYQKVKNEQDNGRFPKDIYLVYVEEIRENEEIRIAACNEVKK